MDSPLTVAELSRLRKAIQQRDRLVAQGLATSSVDLRISSALSNLKLYLPTQTQLAVVLKDWETSDAAKRCQIAIWLQQNVLDGTPSQESAPPPVIPLRPAFAHPPPPPALPSRTGSISRPTSLSGTPPIPASARVTPVQVPPNSNNAYPPREIHTQARLKPPTPPPKERASQIVHESLTRRHTLAGRPEPLRQSSTSVNADSPSTSLYPSAFSGFNSSQPGVATDSTRRFGTQTSQMTPLGQSHTPNPPGLTGHDSNQYHTPPSSGQPTQTAQPPSNFAPGYANPHGLFTPGLQGGPSPYNQQFIDAMAKIQAQQAQQNSMLIQQLTQAQQSPASNTTAQILAAAQQQQAQHQADFLQQLQVQQAATSNNTTQLLANIQQQQQAQTNQMMSILQQYQQNAPSFNPNQNIQSNQQVLDLLSQMQSGGTPGVDWASIASGSGMMDPTALMSLVMGGMDPTNLASLMFG